MYGFRPNRSFNVAVKEMSICMVRKRINYVVDADIQGYFEHVSHE